VVNSLPLVGPIASALAARGNTKSKAKSVRVVVVKPSPKRKTRGPASRTQQSRAMKPLPDNRLTRAPIPVSVNMGATTTRWSFSGKPQDLADYDSTKGIRITGSAISPSLVRVNAASSPGLLSNFINSTVSSTRALVTPKQVDPRIAIMESVFSFYAFRKLKITYIPQNSANTNNQSNQTVFVGWDDNADQASEPSLGSVTPTYVSEMDPSFSVQSVGTQSLLYEHTGTKLWLTDSFNEGDALEFAQGSVFAISSDLTTLATTQTYGYFFFEYVIDFYRPVAVETAASMPRHSSDVKDEKHAQSGNLGLSAALDIPKASYASVVCQPPSPTKSLLAEELRSIKAQHFAGFNPKLTRSTTAACSSATSS